MLRAHVLDSRYCGYSKISAVYLLLSKSGECALIDSGTPGSFDSIIKQMESFGANPSKLSAIFLTHFHLDHSGNVSLFTRRFPHVRVYCSELTLGRVASPENHVRIMTRFVGPRWHSEFGDQVRAVPRNFFKTTSDGMRIPFGSSGTIRVIDAPGHSCDHIAFLEEGSGTLFSGDAFGVRYPIINSRKSFVAIPPGFDPKDVYATLKKLGDIPNVHRAGLSHYGFVDNVKEHADQCIRFMDKLMGIGRRAGNIKADLTALYTAEFGKDAMRLHRLRGNLLANQLGIQEWFRPSVSSKL
jgi:glyoxylase-like metal-dependent hydrolase (beta-lactamase superfamily II)